MAAAPAAPKALLRAEAALRAHALAFPGAWEDFPWGEERALKVGKKIFAMLYIDAEGLSLSVKLPDSSFAALAFPFASPTAYGLGRAHWVTARFGPKDRLPVELLRAWIDESWRAIAPKRLAPRP